MVAVDKGTGHKSELSAASVALLAVREVLVELVPVLELEEDDADLL